MENKEKTNRGYGMVPPKIPAQFRVISSFSFCMRLKLSKNCQKKVHIFVKVTLIQVFRAHDRDMYRKTDFFREVDTESKTCFDVTFTDF